MALAEAFAGSATISTNEYSLVNNSTSIATSTAPGVYQLFLDVNAVAAGDQFEVYLREKVQSSGTQRQISLGVITQGQGPLWITGAFQLMNGWDLTIKRLAGADRAIAWSIRKAA
jgi:hypothetical protein